jgi:hypothetical protein
MTDEMMSLCALLEKSSDAASLMASAARSGSANAMAFMRSGKIIGRKSIPSIRSSASTARLSGAPMWSVSSATKRPSCASSARSWLLHHDTGHGHLVTAPVGWIHEIKHDGLLPYRRGAKRPTGVACRSRAELRVYRLRCRIPFWRTDRWAVDCYCVAQRCDPKALMPRL